MVVAKEYKCKGELPSSLLAVPPIDTDSFEEWNPDRKDEIDNLEDYRYKLTIIDHQETVNAIQTRSASLPRIEYPSVANVSSCFVRLLAYATCSRRLEQPVSLR
jgi:hypothetical protein